MRPEGPRTRPRPGALPLPSPGGCPGRSSAWGPAQSLLTRLLYPIHSFLGFSPSFNKWVRRWEGASVSKCDICASRSFSSGISAGTVSRSGVRCQNALLRSARKGPSCPRRAVAARSQVFGMFASAPSPAGYFLNLQVLLISSLALSSHTFPHPPRFTTTLQA